MAENKKSFVLYSDYNEVFNELSDVDAGQLIKHILKYVNDENPITENPIVKVSFIPIKLQLKRDLIKYEDKKEQWSLAGKASAESKRLKKINEINERTTDSTTVKNVTTESTVNVNDTVNVNEINNKKAQTLLTVNFLKWFNEMKFKHKGIKGNFKTLTKTDLNNLKELKKANYTPEDFEHAYKIMIDTEWVKINKIDTPTHFLVNTNFSKYVNTVITNESKFNPYG